MIPKACITKYGIVLIAFAAVVFFVLSEEERFGGRILTHYFDTEKNFMVNLELHVSLQPIRQHGIISTCLK